MNYVLREKKIVKIDNTLEWAREFESMDRRVARTVIGEREVSTVFLGVDMAYTEQRTAAELLAQLVAELGVAGLAIYHHVNAARFECVAQQVRLGRLSRAVDSLQCNQNRHRAAMVHSAPGHRKFAAFGVGGKDEAR